MTRPRPDASTAAPGDPPAWRLERVAFEEAGAAGNRRHVATGPSCVQAGAALPEARRHGQAGHPADPHLAGLLARAAVAALALACFTLPSAAADAANGPPEAKAPARPTALATSAACRPAHAWRCHAGGCEPADEGLHAEQFELDVATATLSACLYTDCYEGRALLSRDPARPWVVTAVGEVRSSRPAGGAPPPGSAPFPITLTVDLRDGRFTATWSHGPDGLQADFGTCRLRR